MAGHRRDARPERAHLRQHFFLVGRIGVGMEQADRHGLDAFGLEAFDDRRQAGEVQRLALGALVGHPARHLSAQVARDEGLWLEIVQVEEIRAVAAGDFQRIAEAFGGDQPDLDALALGQGVDHNRGPVGHEVDGRRVDPALLQHLNHAGFVVRRCGVRLGGADPDPVRAAFEGDQIGEGSPDIGRNAQRFHRSHSSACCAIRKASAPGSFRASDAATRSGV